MFLLVMIFTYLKQKGDATSSIFLYKLPFTILFTAQFSLSIEFANCISFEE